MMRQVNVPLKYCLLMSCFLIVPLSTEYWIQHFIGYYHHFYIKTFLMMGCFFALFQRRKKRAAGVLYAALLYALAFLTGTEGIRIFYSFLLPLVLTVILAAHFDVIEEKIAAYRISFTALGLSFLGFLVNTIVLKKFFVFAGLEKAAVENFGYGFFDKFSHIFFDFYASFWGYEYAHVLSGEGFLSVVSLLFFMASIAGFVIYIKNVCTKHKKQLFLDLCRNYSIECFLLLYFIITLLFHFVFFMFINGFNDTVARYFFPALIFLFAAIPVFLTFSLPRTNRLVHSCLCIVLCGFLFGHGILLFDKQINSDENHNINRNGYLAYLEANSLVYGFAPFWTGNVTTELSNGRIEMVGLWGVENEFARYKWLSPVKFDNPYYHKEKAFLLLRKDEWEAIKGRAVFADKSPAYMDDFYVVLVYPEAAVIHREVMRENF
jgi:hypothetical protein